MALPHRLHGVELQPDPNDKFFGDGNWAENAWFMETAFDAEFERLGWGRPRRERAFRGLAQLFTPEEVQRIDVRWRGGLVLDLMGHRRWPHLVVPLLEVGLDIDEVQPWEDTGLVTRLRLRESAHLAAFELRSWANLKRSGLHFERIREKPPSKTPDFRVQLDGRWFVVECKVCDVSEAEDVSEEWWLGSVPFRADVMIDGYDAAIQPSNEYALLNRTAAGRTRLRAEMDLIRAAFMRAAAQARAAPSPPASVEVPPFGRLSYRKTADGSTGSEDYFVASLTPEQEATRVRRQVRDALDQMKGYSEPGVPVIAAPYGLPAAVAVVELRADREREPSAYAQCGFIVLVGYETTSGGDRHAVPVIVSEKPPSEAQTRFARDLVRREVRNPWAEE